MPPGWGEVEPDAAGGFVIHNRPRRFRLDGDAVWYASAIELRVRPGATAPSRSAEAMTVEARIIDGRAGPVLVELAMANGLGEGQRRIARRVLDGVTAIIRRRP